MSEEEDASQELLEQLKKIDGEFEKKDSFKSRFAKAWKTLKIKSALGHIGLLVLLSIYCAVGGIIFRQLELPAELMRVEELRKTVTEQRLQFLFSIANSTNVRRLDNLDQFVSIELQKYEEVAQRAVEGGLKLSVVDSFPVIFKKWSVSQAVFFSSTVLTTIGYGIIVPVTTGGRTFCMFFALIGIPFTLTVIADLGRMFATGVSTLSKKLPSLTRCCRADSPSSVISDRKWLYALAAVCFLLLYLGVGAGLLLVFEDSWSFFDGYYFCFIMAMTGPFADTLRRMQLSGAGIDVGALQRVLTVSMPHRRNGTYSSDKKQHEQDIAALAALTQEQPKVMQIIIYESSV